jgi:putative transposase
MTKRGKGYGFPDVRELVDDYDYIARIRKSGEGNIRTKLLTIP